MRRLCLLAVFVALGGCTCDPGTADAVPDAGQPADAGDPNNALKDTDCDLVSDADEFALSFSGRKTDPNNADSDGDGVPDGVEMGRTTPIVGTCPVLADADPTTTTDPTLADSDGDGLADGAEDADHDGQIDPGESNPSSIDGDCDGLADPEERSGAAGCATDPLNADTDGDGIPDGVEAGVTSAATCSDAATDADPSTRTSPCAADTDTDGIFDGAEDLDQNGRKDPGELDPLNSSDGQGPAAKACATQNLRVVQFPKSGPVDVQAALVPEFAEVQSFTAGGAARGLVLYDATNKIAGAVIGKTPEGITAADEETAVRARLAALGALSNPLTRTFTTWDGLVAVRATYDFAGSDDLKDRLAAMVRAFYPNVTNLLAGTAGESGPFSLLAEMVIRSPSRAVLVFALTPTARAVANTFRTDDVAGGSALAQVLDTNGVQCEVFQFGGGGVVDFLWVVDDSGSMAASQDAVGHAGSEMVARLKNSTLDWRMGAVTTDHARTGGTTAEQTRAANAWRPFIENTDPSAGAIVNAWFKENNLCQTCLSANACSTTSGRCGATNCGNSGDRCTLSNTLCDQGCWFGIGGTGTEKALLSARRYISNTLLPASSAAPPPAKKLRAGAKLQMILLADADDQSVSSDVGGSTDFVGFFTNYFTNYDGQSSAAVVHGIVCPLGGICPPPPSNPETQQNPRRNIGVVQNTGGVLGSILIAQDASTNPIAAAQFDATIGAILSAAIGAAGHPLGRPPIAATIKVAIEGGGTLGSCNTDDVPRSRQNGFDFDSTTGRLSFFGACRPLAGRTIAVSYRYWIDRSAPPTGVYTGCGIEETCYDSDAGPPDGGGDAGSCLAVGATCVPGIDDLCCGANFCQAVTDADGGVINICKPIG